MPPRPSAVDALHHAVESSVDNALYGALHDTVDTGVSATVYVPVDDAVRDGVMFAVELTFVRAIDPPRWRW